MNSKLFLVLRILYGLFLLFFGLNKFFDFIIFVPETENAVNYLEALEATKTMHIVAIIEIIAGLSLLLNKFGALLMVILMSISINAVLYHGTLEPATIAGSIILIVFNVIMLYGYKDQYTDLLEA
ncbi:DoxX family membrane protein [uncultured Maribacter sp.]|uniref:DoxX family membrane protein n=1 Tax=uncultured Maribacter sp. TaxID=431308 RepID=UPI00260BCB0A|nr:DoxX family membrane protein [uncultured Maribacter sp.]